MQWGDFFIGWWNLTRSDFDCSENCFLVGGRREEGGNKNLMGGVCWGGEGDFSWWGGISKFLASGGKEFSPVGKTLITVCQIFRLLP